MVNGTSAATLLLVSLTAFLHSQSTSASLTGRITDPSKALVGNAAIAAISAGTNVRYATLANLSGEYHLANLSPGAYRIEIEKPGFKKLIQAAWFFTSRMPWQSTSR